MKKNIIATLLMMLSVVWLTACSPTTTNVANVVYNGTMVTTSSLNIYDKYDSVNYIIANHMDEYTPEEQIALKSISKKFNTIKLEIYNITNNSADIAKITMHLDEYLDIYNDMEIDYLKARDIISENYAVYTELEKKVLVRFDEDAIVLYDQVQLVKEQVKNVADKNDIDITNLVEKTYGIAKALSTIAVLVL